jgi:prepilin-type N-terminal cleavage/methylation domain-containing protein
MLGNLKRRKPKKGFTLIELVCVLAIMGVLSAIAIPRVLVMQDSAKLAGVETNITTIMSALTFFLSENEGSIPALHHATVAEGGNLNALRGYLASGNTVENVHELFDVPSAGIRYHLSTTPDAAILEVIVPGISNAKERFAGRNPAIMFFGEGPVTEGGEPVEAVVYIYNFGRWIGNRYSREFIGQI